MAEKFKQSADFGQSDALTVLSYLMPKLEFDKTTIKLVLLADQITYHLSALAQVNMEKLEITMTISHETFFRLTNHIEWLDKLTW